MCILIALHRRVPGAPLVVAANRDEFVDRAAEGPALRWTPRGAIVAPRDVRAGGTWVGLNEAGLFAAVTNRRCEDPDPRHRSRGMLVLDALGARSAIEAKEKVEEQTLRSHLYNPFNLFIADRRRAYAITYADRAECFELEPGVHVIGNEALGARPGSKLRGVAERVDAALDAAGRAVLDALAGICRSHDDAAENPLDSACVHAGAYGTRSSLLLSLSEHGFGGELRFSDGPPCRTPYRDFTPLLRALGQGSRRVGGATPRSVH